MGDQIAKLLFDPTGPLGMTAGFFLNAVAEFDGFVLGTLVFSLLIPLVIDARQSRKWRPARQNFGQELLLLHVAFGESLLHWRVKQTRDMFAQANKAFNDLLDVGRFNRKGFHAKPQSRQENSRFRRRRCHEIPF